MMIKVRSDSDNDNDSPRLLELRVSLDIFYRIYQNPSTNWILSAENEALVCGYPSVYVTDLTA